MLDSPWTHIIYVCFGHSDKNALKRAHGQWVFPDAAVLLRRLGIIVKSRMTTSTAFVGRLSYIAQFDAPGFGLRLGSLSGSSNEALPRTPY